MAEKPSSENKKLDPSKENKSIDSTTTESGQQADEPGSVTPVPDPDPEEDTSIDSTTTESGQLADQPGSVASEPEVSDALRYPGIGTDSLRPPREWDDDDFYTVPETVIQEIRDPGTNRVRHVQAAVKGERMHRRRALALGLIDEGEFDSEKAAKVEASRPKRV